MKVEKKSVAIRMTTKTSARLQRATRSLAELASGVITKCDGTSAKMTTR